MQNVEVIKKKTHNNVAIIITQRHLHFRLDAILFIVCCLFAFMHV